MTPGDGIQINLGGRVDLQMSSHFFLNIPYKNENICSNPPPPEPLLDPPLFVTALGNSNCPLKK